MDVRDGYYLKIEMFGHKLIALLDTGATISVLGSNLLEEIEELRSTIVQSKLPRVRVLGGNHVSVKGEVYCTVELSNEVKFRSQNFKILTQAMKVPVILGMDFIRNNKIIIDAHHDRIFFHNERDIKVELPVSWSCREDHQIVRSVANLTLEPGECKLLPVNVRGMNSSVGYILPMLTEDQLPGYAGAARLNSNNGKLKMEVVNNSDASFKISKGMKVALWQPICRMISVPNENDLDKLYEQLNVHNMELSTHNLELLKNVIEEHREVFSRDDNDLGYCDTIKHKIEVGDSPPLRHRYRRMYDPIKTEVDQEIERMKQQGIIENSKSPWSSPLVPIKKKSGKWRITVDYRQLNAVTKFNSYPLPCIGDILSQFAGASFFSTLDLLSGYHQVALDEESKERTAFITDSGLYQFRVMPQGACGSPATFQQLMNIVLKDIAPNKASAYLDDIIVLGTSFEDHLNNLAEVFRCLKQHGLKLSGAKCDILKDKVTYLGHTISKEGVQPADHNIEALLKLEAPKTVKEVKRINGLINYYCRFVPDLALKMAPLYDITKEKKLKWTTECQKVLDEVKAILTSKPLLAFPRFGIRDTFILTTDGSGAGLGAMLSQLQEGIEKPIGYASVSFNKAQHHYSATEKEIAALRFGVKHFKDYLYGRKYTVRVDHQALIYLDQMKMVDHRLLRTYEDLMIGEFTLEYIKGKENVVADVLSRFPLPKRLSMEDEKDYVPCRNRPIAIMVTPGGPNSLLEALSGALNDQETKPSDLREDIVNYILEHPTKYGYKNKAKERKILESMKAEGVFADQSLIKPFVDLHGCNVTVYHNPGPIVHYNTDGAGTKIELECLGGVHFNVVSLQQEIEDQGPLINAWEKKEEVIHAITDDRDVTINCSDIFNSNDTNSQKAETQSDLQEKDSDIVEEAPQSLTEVEIREIVNDIHEDIHHAGVGKTIHACKSHIKQKIKGLYRIVKECIRGCLTCQQYKPFKQSNHQRFPLMNLMPEKPGEEVALDLLDLGNSTKDRNKVVLVGIDVFTKFGYAVPLKNKTSKAVVRALETSILAGMIHLPKVIRTDGGPEFRSQEFGDLLDKYNIKHNRSIPYYPQSNGTIERFNRTLKGRLATAVQGDYLRWDLEIAKIIVQYNRSVHRETGRTPVSFYSKLPEELVIKKSPYWREAGSNFKPFQVGDQVLRKIPFHTKKTRHKLAPIYEGPCTVIEVLSGVTYRIQDNKRKAKIAIVHFSQIRPYHQAVDTRVYRRSKEAVVASQSRSAQGHKKKGQLGGWQTTDEVCPEWSQVVGGGTTQTNHGVGAELAPYGLMAGAPSSLCQYQVVSLPAIGGIRHDEDLIVEGRLDETVAVEDQGSDEPQVPEDTVTEGPDEQVQGQHVDRPQYMMGEVSERDRIDSTSLSTPPGLESTRDNIDEPHRRTKTHAMRLRSDTRENFLDANEREISPIKDTLTLTGVFNTSYESFPGFEVPQAGKMESRQTLIRDINQIAAQNDRLLADKGTVKGGTLVEDFAGFQELQEIRKQRELAFQKLQDCLQNCNKKIDEVLQDSGSGDSSLLESLRAYVGEASEDAGRLKELEEIKVMSKHSEKFENTRNVEDWDLSSGEVIIEDTEVGGSDDTNSREVTDRAEELCEALPYEELSVEEPQGEGVPSERRKLCGIC